ncbi:MAG: DUF1638 domain-containing protein [Deltaproteobacteria bacterium]|nr:DUF1638 domain-containing protein [Deltaproteobacteria bacterium]
MESAEHPQPPERPVVIACRVMEPELEAVRAGAPAVEIIYLEQGLHRTPKKLPGMIQERIDQAASYATVIVLGYGLCSNGLVGVTARRQKLIVPRCHDCISLFLGSPARYDAVFRDHPGTFYLTPGWVKQNQDPLGTYEVEYLPKYGREVALWAIRESLKNYTHIALIHSGMPESEALRRRALENAEFLNMTYIEMEGNLSYFEKIIRGPYKAEEFLHLQPGETISQSLYF